MATSDEIKTAAATNASTGITSASVDGRSSSALSPLTQLDVADRVAANDALAASVSDGKHVARLLGMKAKARFPSTTD